MALQMLDVSSNNHPDDKAINWQAVGREGYEVVIIKATEGVDYTNPWLERDASRAHLVMTHIGYYHFARPAIGTALEQAEYALDAIKGLPRDIGLSLDLEETGGLSVDDLTIFAENFLARLAQENVTSPVYLNPAFLELLPKAPFGHKLWLADWERTPRRQCWAWQMGMLAVPGIIGRTDVGVWYG